MHELSIAQSILAIAENAAPKGGVITAVRLQVGELSGIERQALEFALSIIKKDTVLDKAEVEIDAVEGEAECRSCGTVFPLHALGTPCPQCAGYSLNVLKGREMRVVNLLVEE